MSFAGKTLKPGDLVRHVRFGIGKVRLDEGETAVVRFEDGLQECDKGELEAVAAPLQEIFASQWHSPIEVITRAQAAAIESVNDMSGRSLDLAHRVATPPIVGLPAGLGNVADPLAGCGRRRLGKDH